MASIVIEAQAEGIVENPGIMSDSEPGTDDDADAELQRQHQHQQHQQQYQYDDEEEDAPPPRRRRSSAADAFAEAAQARRMSYEDLDSEIQRRRTSIGSSSNPPGDDPEPPAGRVSHTSATAGTHAHAQIQAQAQTRRTHARIDTLSYTHSLVHVVVPSFLPAPFFSSPRLLNIVAPPPPHLLCFQAVGTWMLPTLKPRWSSAVLNVALWMLHDGEAQSSRSDQRHVGHLSWMQNHTLTFTALMKRYG